MAAVLNMKAVVADGSNPVLVAKANCGIPEFVDGEIVYTGTPEIMANYAVMARDAGARIIGGCCGTTPEHVAAMCEALDNTSISNPPTLDDISRVLGDVTAGAKAQARGQHQLPERFSGRKRRRR